MSGDAAVRPLQAPVERRELIALLAILALASLLRGIGLDAPLWYDEVVTLVEYVRLPAGDLLTKYTTTNNHVLYSLAANASVAVFGESAWSLRLPAALFGVASIAAFWQLARRLATVREALLASLLLAVSYHHVWFSQNARGYTGLMFFTLLGTSLFLDGMRGSARTLWLAYGLVLALGLYTHLSAVFVFVSHALIYSWLLLRAKLAHRTGQNPGGEQWWPMLGFALGALGTLALYSSALPQIWQTFGAQQAGSGGTRVEDWTDPVWTLLEMIRGVGLGAGSALAAATLGALGAAGLWSLARRDLLVGALIVLPVLLTLGTLLAFSFHIWPRYFLVSIGFAALALVRGCAVAGELVAHGAATRIGSSLVGLALLGSLLLLPANYRHPKQDFEAARDYVEERREGHEAIVAVGLAIYPYSQYYAPDWQTAESLPELDEIRARPSRTWVVSSFPTYLSAIHPELAARLEDEFELVREFPGTLGDGTVSVFRSRGPESSAASDTD